MEQSDSPGWAYKTLIAAGMPFVDCWGRLEVEGLENLPASGPVLLCGNHDSYWDPLAIGRAAWPRRQIHALAKHSLWKIPVLRTVITEAGQIPVVRGSGDRAPLEYATKALADGACIGIFVEGTRSLGRPLPARSGLGYLAAATPEAEVVCVSVTGAVDIPRLTLRPRVKVRFFKPAGGKMKDSESRQEFCQRLLDEIRADAPRAIAGRKRRKAAERGESPA